jgi:AcrR family transcriptional regulator
MSQVVIATPRRPRPGGRSARIVASVLATTVDVLVDHGYDGLSIAEIAERSGVHETSIYRRWGTKPQLVTEALTRNAAQSLSPPDTGSFLGDLNALLRSVMSWLETPMGRPLSQVLTSPDPDLAPLRRTYWNNRLEVIRVIVARAKKRDEVPFSLDPRLVMEMCAGPITLRRISGESVTPRYIKKLIERVVIGLQLK